MPRPPRRASTWLAAAGAALCACGAAAGEQAALRFEREGELVRRIDLETLRASCDVARISIDDPYYGKRKSFLACPLRQVLALGFGEDPAALAGEDFFLRARDGYVKPASGARLNEPGGYLAFADAERSLGDWEPIDRRQVDPGPFYLVWSQPHQRDPHRYPWPYQLVAFEIAPFEREYPHTLPRSAPAGSPAWSGFAVFRAECIACHAINGEGGVVGPELNVPRSIVEYRPVEQIRAYIRDPQAFRYTSMPAHRHLSDAQLDALIAYFEAMKGLKRDQRPGARTEGTP
ncbi:MAG: cytochrome c [Myxococcota bacterium]